jgi:hypothetical protein
MAKQLIFERAAQVGPEQVTLRLYRAHTGLLLERSLGQQDGRVLVQVLSLPSVEAMDQLEEFSAFDEHIKALAVSYNEVFKRARAEFDDLIPNSGRLMK